MQGSKKDTRYKFIPAKAVPDFDTIKSTEINLAYRTQRNTQKNETDKFKFYVKRVRALKGVA